MFKAWGHQDLTIDTVCRRLSRSPAAAVHDDALDKGPSLPAHRARPEPLRLAVLLGFTWLRTAEVVGLRIDHIDFLHLYLTRSTRTTRGTEVEGERDAGPDLRASGPRSLGRRGAGSTS